jgi:putative membrane protein
VKKTILLAAACVLLANPALAQSAPPTSEFVQKVAIGDMFEIEASRLIAPTADADTKPFAEKMVKDHTQTSTELKQLISSGKVKAELPTKLDAQHQKKLDDLKKLSGKELDTAYDRMQLEAHREAVDLFTRYSQAGDNPDLKQWAAKTLPHLKEHLAMAEKLK